MQFQNRNIHLNIFFTKYVHDWKVEVVSDFFELYSQRVRQGVEDKICWILSKRKLFDVDNYYHLLSILVSFHFP